MESSTLSLLPPELRDLIYSLTFTSTYATTLKTQHIQHPLTQTCRQLRRETLAMYLSLTRFNAHLDDGPATPLAIWLQTIGPRLCLWLCEVNIWDMHMLNGSLHGVEATRCMLRDGARAVSPDDSEDEDSEVHQRRRPYVLKPVGRDIFHGSWYLKDLILTLQTLGLGLQRFCEVEGNGVLKQTSHFAIQPMPDPNINGNEGNDDLIDSFGLSTIERAQLMRQLDAGNRCIQLPEGRRNIFLTFDVSRRLVGMRQQFIPREEEFYM